MRTSVKLNILIFLCLFSSFLQAQPPIAKPPLNIILIVSDQETYKIPGINNFRLPARQRLQREGITFRNHYTAAAMCSPSRATFLTGTPPQVNGVYDEMEYPFVQDLDPTRPNMGSILKSLGYRTAYFGKFEMNKALLAAKNNVNYSTLAAQYGFDSFNPDGDVGGSPQQGYTSDSYFVGEAVRWLRENASKTDRPFFLVLGLLNPHDIMYGDANIPGFPLVQKPGVPVILPPPPNTIYKSKWAFPLPVSLNESLTAPGMPNALLEYQTGWAGTLGYIPTHRQDMWHFYINYYFNAIRDNDNQLQRVIAAMDEQDLWKNTVIIYTADHGEMGGAHGGLRGKGPMAYEENAHIPLIIVHPNGPRSAICTALTSHIDLLPTLVALTGLPADKRGNATKELVGRDFSSLLQNPSSKDLHAIRPGILFNYVSISTIDGAYLLKMLEAALGHKPPLPPLTDVNLNKRGFLAFVFDGRYKYARYYAPNHFNTPKTIEEIFNNNDVQLFDLQNDPYEMTNLALDKENNKDLIMQMNTLLNELMAKEVGVNDGKFLPIEVKPKVMN